MNEAEEFPTLTLDLHMHKCVQHLRAHTHTCGAGGVREMGKENDVAGTRATVEFASHVRGPASISGTVESKRNRTQCVSSNKHSSLLV